MEDFMKTEKYREDWLIILTRNYAS
jgi:hypothetical protein